MKATASVAFPDGNTLAFTCHTIGWGKEWHWPGPDDQQFSGRTWRLLTDDCAVELWPLCDGESRLLAGNLPSFDRLEIWPVCWGYPDTLIRDHPDEVEQMRLDHLAGKHELIDGNYTWQHWLAHYGMAELWAQFRTPEMEKHWLSWRNGPGSSLHTFSGLEGRICCAALKRISFRADFYSGGDCYTIYLENCVRVPFSPEEYRTSPAYLARMEKHVKDQETVAAKLAATAKAVSKATEIGDMYSTPSMADAKNAAISAGIPKEFVVHCHTEMHARRFPSTDQAYKAVCNLSMFRALRDPKTPSRTTVWRWLSVIRGELEKRGLLMPRGKVKSAKRASIKDPARLASPAPTSDNADTVTTDTRDSELEQDPESYNLPDRSGWAGVR